MRSFNRAAVVSFLSGLLLVVSVLPAKPADPIKLDGSGSVMAIIDTGIDATLPQFKGKIIGEACFTSNKSCPNGTNEQVGTGAATLSTQVASNNGLSHGTAMASVALQIAPGAKLFMIRDAGINVSGQMTLSVSDLQRAVSWVAKNAKSYGITSLSISQGSTTMNCTAADKSQMNLDINSLIAQGIPTFAAAGNGGLNGKIDWPSCSPAAISVGGLDKKSGSQALPYEPGGPATMSNASNDVDIWALFAWKTAIPGGAYSITTGTSNSAAAMNGYWSIVRQAKPSASFTEIWSAITSTSTKIASTRASNVQGINASAAAEKLSGSAVQLVDGTPNFPITSNATLVETNATGVIDNPPVITVYASSPSDLAKSFQGGFFKLSGLVTDDAAIAGVKIFITGPDKVRRLLSTPIPKSSSLQKMNLDEYLVLDWSLPIGDYQVSVEATDGFNTTSVAGGTFTLRPTPADNSRPTLSPNTTYASMASKAPLLPGATVRIWFNGQDDLRINDCKYIIYDPNGVRTEYPTELISSTLNHYRSCNAYWTVPANAIAGGKYLIKGYASDSVGFGSEFDFSFVVVSKKIQTINFNTLATSNYGTPVKLTATSSSGLPVDFVTITPTLCAIRKDNTGIYVDGIKPANNTNVNCIVNAVQPGDAIFEAATQVQRAITFTNPAAAPVNVDPRTVKASYNLPTPTKPTLAIIDTAVQASLPIFKDRIIFEVCIIEWPSCPNGQRYMEGPGAAVLQTPYISMNGFDHGTQMASIAASVNPNMNILFIRVIGATSTGTRQIANEATVANALAWIKNNAATFNIQAVSMSQGHHNLANSVTNYCPSTQTTKDLITDLKLMDIPVFLPTGNGSDYVRIDWPACISEAIAIGSADANGTPVTTANYDPLLTDYLALGTYRGTLPSGQSTNSSGTSVATVVAASQYLMVRSAKPTLNARDVFTLLSSTAKVVQGRNYATNKVIDIAAALK